jgi:hypothetical protein
MMAVWCEGCGAEVLLWPTDIKGIVNTAEGAIVAYRCGSGHDGATLIRRWGAAPGVPSVAAGR